MTAQQGLPSGTVNFINTDYQLIEACVDIFQETIKGLDEDSRRLARPPTKHNSILGTIFPELLRHYRTTIPHTK